MLRVDAKTPGRVAYFKKTHFNSCRTKREAADSKKRKRRSGDVGKLFKRMQARATSRAYTDDGVRCTTPDSPQREKNGNLETENPAGAIDPDLGIDM